MDFDEPKEYPNSEFEDFLLHDQAIEEIRERFGLAIERMEKDIVVMQEKLDSAKKRLEEYREKYKFFKMYETFKKTKGFARLKQIIEQNRKDIEKAQVKEENKEKRKMKKLVGPEICGKVLKKVKWYADDKPRICTRPPKHRGRCKQW